MLASVGLLPAAPCPAGSQEGASKTTILRLYDAMPLRFERNLGQTAAEVEYVGRGRGYRVFLTRTEPVLSAGGSSEVVRLRLRKANPRPEVTGLDELPGRSHYYIGSDPKEWLREVPQYGRVRYRDVYPGIDLVFHCGQGQLEYDFVVAPGADPSRIRLAFEGARSLRLDGEGNLVLQLRSGAFVQHAPVVYQEVQGGRNRVSGRHVLKGKREVAFELGRYDRAAALVIDPVLAYSTFAGGSSGDSGTDIAVDGSGNAYIAGSTSSADFPTAGTPSQGIFGGTNDAFVMKLNSTSARLYSTYLGGSAHDGDWGGRGPDVVVDHLGNAYLTGATLSGDFPTAGTPSQPLHGGGGIDTFVTKLGPSSQRVYSTYLGGSGNETPGGITVDPAGNAYVTGDTIRRISRRPEPPSSPRMQEESQTDL